ncbi:MAG: hypothetical protein EOO11_04655 [Chitinophagaceae bacterium]|nr:MAG: hypothetical protein EOO11_04655 [Chitinophagaceae bacterium]
MRATLPVIILPLLVNSARAQVWVQEKRYHNHLEAEGLKGPVRSMTEIQYKWMMPNGDSGRPRISYTKLYRYNRTGNLEAERLIRIDGSTGHLDSFLYDARGRLQQRIGMEPTRAGSKVATLYFYDASGNLAREVATMREQVLLSTSTYQYDARGRRTERVRESVHRRETERIAYTYDARGRKLTERTSGVPQTTLRTFSYPAPGTVKTHYLYERPAKPGDRIEADAFERRDEDGRLLQQEYDHKAAEPHCIYSYRVDASGNWTTRYVADERQPGKRYVLQERHIEYERQR